MGLELQVTNIGKTRELNAWTTGQPMPKVAKMVIGDGVAVTNIAEIEQLTALVHQVYEVPIEPPTQPDPLTLLFESVLGDDVELLHIREIGLVLEDGTLYAYSPYSTLSPDGGATKARGFKLHLITAVTRKSSGGITLTISPLDTVQMATDIAARSRAFLDQEVQGQLIPLVMTIKNLQRDILLKQDAINGLTARLARLS